LMIGLIRSRASLSSPGSVVAMNTLCWMRPAGGAAALDSIVGWREDQIDALITALAAQIAAHADELGESGERCISKAGRVSGKVTESGADCPCSLAAAAPLAEKGLVAGWSGRRPGHLPRLRRAAATIALFGRRTCCGCPENRKA